MEFSPINPFLLSLSQVNLGPVLQVSWMQISFLVKRFKEINKYHLILRYFKHMKGFTYNLLHVVIALHFTCFPRIIPKGKIKQKLLNRWEK